MSIFNDLKKRAKNHHFIMFVAAAALVYAIYQYSDMKGMSFEGYGDAGMQAEGSYEGSSPSLGANFAPVDGPSGVAPNMASGCVAQNVANPSELLPKDENSEWARLNPMGKGDLQNVNLLNAGYHVGIDTVGTSLRNANLQVRSEPPNPQLNVGPWNQTTIAPDLMRVPLEIGCGPQ